MPTTQKTVLRPIGGKIVVRRAEAETTSPGGIVLPDTGQEPPKRGEVLAVGPGTLIESGARVDMQVKVGDQVVFGAYAGTEITLDDEKLLIMEETEVLAIADG